ncbi:unnamed protein product, partial [Rotaria socialis]
LKHDQIGVQGTEYLANMLKINKTLVDIDLTNNQISNDGAKSIANALHNNTTLTVLNLSTNTILREEAHYLANALEMNKTLKEMYVSSNQIGDDGLEYLRASLEKNITLTKLHIGSNGITNTMYKEKLYSNNLRDLMKFDVPEPIHSHEYEKIRSTIISRQYQSQQPIDYENNIFIHFTFCSSMRQFPKEFHNLWQKYFNSTPITDIQPILGTRNVHNLQQELFGNH